MATSQKSVPDDANLMGVHGDVLFADPLGVRAKSAAAGAGSGDKKKGPVWNEPSRPSAGGTGRTAHMTQQENMRGKENEDGWFGSMLGALLNSGTQCCSMRDRAKDAEAARAAAETGRPPAPEQRTFPAPRRKEQSEPVEDVDLTRPQHHPEAHQAEERAPTAASRGERSLSPTDADNYLHGGPEHNLDLDGTRRAPRLVPPQNIALDDTRQAPRPANQRQPSPQRSATPPPAPGQTVNMPGHWKWPAWTLNMKDPCIEVYVVDDETGEGRWCDADPQSRVVDKSGFDAYLCAEYDWDGEFYVQDFAPHHVRRRGQKLTVLQMVEQANNAAQKSGVAADADPDATMRVKRPQAASRNGRQGDTGGGVMSFLDDD